MTKLNLLIVALCTPLLLSGQIDTMALKSIEGITNKMIELISGDIDEPRNWNEYRNLFLPTAIKISINRNARPNRQIKARNLEEFVREVGPAYKKSGFEEVSIGLTVNEFNGIANVFQSYYCKNLTGTYEKRGVNSYQLVYADNRWWIASTTFSNETDENQLPNKYLDKAHQSKN